MDTQLYRYPRTFHVDFSEGMTSDDKRASKETLAYLRSGIELICSEKMDGGNVTGHRHGYYARSLDSGTPAWEKVGRAAWSRIAHEIPEGYRFSMESMYAEKSVRYENLEHPLYLLGVWNPDNVLLSYDESAEWGELLGLPLPELIYRGTDYDAAVTAWAKKFNTTISEGWVVRDAGEIPYAEFSNRVIKWVRAGHVTDARPDWRHRTDFTANGFIGNTFV